MLTAADRVSMDITCNYEKVGIVSLKKYNEFWQFLPPGTIGYDDGMLFNSPKHPEIDVIAIYKRKGTNPNFALFNEKCQSDL